MRVQCPAKVNLFLEVTGQRKNGYHTLSTLFAKINIYDVLDFKFANGASRSSRSWMNCMLAAYRRDLIIW